MSEKVAMSKVLAQAPTAGVERGSVCLGGQLQLAKGRVHEVTGHASDTFAALVCACLQGPVLWIGRGHKLDELNPAGLRAFVDPARVVQVAGVTRKEVLWAAEQSLRARVAATVVVELSRGPDLRESRRLQLAVEQGGGLGLVLVAGRVCASAAYTRWDTEICDEGEESWRWTLSKNRQGGLGSWRVKPERGGGGGVSGVIRLVATAAT